MENTYSDFAIGAVIKVRTFSSSLPLPVYLLFFTQSYSLPQGDGQVTNLDYHREGQMLVMGTSNNSLYLIDCLSGQLRKKLFTKTAGLGQVQYTHHEYSILCTSEKTSNDIRYYCLYDNRYLRYYRGHTDQVVSIAMSPVDDHFLSASSDQTVCMWSLASLNPVAKLALPPGTESPRVAYDNSGLVFGVMAKSLATGQHTLKLFDARNYEKGPFVDIAPTQSIIEQTLARADPTMESSQIHRVLASSWHDMSFSPDGAKILVNTASDVLLCLDAFRPDIPPIILSGRKNLSNSHLGACFTPDSKYILCGTDDKQMLIYDPLTGERVANLNGEHVALITSVKCNPKYDMIASGCVNTALWIRNGANNS
jgi:COMPASS component SWD2